MQTPSIFILPVLDRFLLYAPLSGAAALVDGRAVSQLRGFLADESAPLSPPLRSLYTSLCSAQKPAPQLFSGPLSTPLFLGLVTTRSCNMACRYCDFLSPKQNSPVMSLALARQALDEYFLILSRSKRRRAEVQFFGGEPFFAADVIHFSVAYARSRAAELGMTARFEVTTNGLFSPRECAWVASHFDSVVLSLDGPADVQNRYRPGLHGEGTFDAVMANAVMLSHSDLELTLRACVTHETAARMPEIASWAARELHPSAVCFESLVPTAQTRAAGLYPPDPYVFAPYFLQAEEIVNAQGIQAVFSTACLESIQSSFCPVSKDALIVTPDGAVSACYLLAKEWQRAGLELAYGRIDSASASMQTDLAALQNVRDLAANPRPACAGCFCRWHCAGGCHVNHPARVRDDLCIQTRLVSLARLLQRLGEGDLVRTWLADRAAQEASAAQEDDRL